MKFENYMRCYYLQNDTYYNSRDLDRFDEEWNIYKSFSKRVIDDYRIIYNCHVDRKVELYGYRCDSEEEDGDDEEEEDE